MNIIIRLAVFADAPDMANIHARSWEAAYKDIIPTEYIKGKNSARAARWERILSAENKTHYIILNDNTAVGMMTIGAPQYENVETKNDIGIDDSFWELHNIYLHPDYYHRGIGTTALDFAMNKAREAGKTNMLLWVFEENKNAVKFYEKCGFAADGASKVCNCDKEMNCIRMKRSLFCGK